MKEKHSGRFFILTPFNIHVSLSCHYRN